MNKTQSVWHKIARARFSNLSTQFTRQSQESWICTQCLHRHRARHLSRRFQPRPQQRNLRGPAQTRHQSTNNNPNPADQPGFTSILDNPPTLMRSNRRHNPWGLLLLAAIPVTAFALGCWQVQRLGWKTALIAKFEDRLVRDPLPLPPRIDPAAVPEFDYRRVYARGVFRHDQEMLIGPRLHDGKDGYLVITPLERTDDDETLGPGKSKRTTKGNATILVNRGWISKAHAAQATRPAGLPAGEVVVQGLLREPWQKNLFTPGNRPAEGKWYFPDVHEMAAHVGSQAVWIEATMRPDLLAAYDREAKGVPIGRAAEVNLRNNHTQYIFTWFSLSAATSIMLWMVVKKPASGVSRRIRQNKEW